MTVAKHPVLSNRTHVSDLPPSWGTLYELTKLPEDVLRAGLKNGSIHPKMERKDVMTLRAKSGSKRSSKAPTSAPVAHQRTAAKKLGLTESIYQRREYDKMRKQNASRLKLF